MKKNEDQMDRLLDRATGQIREEEADTGATEEAAGRVWARLEEASGLDAGDSPVSVSLAR